ncbi:polyphenol oxidase family protein [Arthrobacter globiformis]|uniref:polyphenol oxidase family protein n=1 Tax=Arthrobacter globiformis TaxID=1665 RepID=UPI0027939200|nr:polyphenol oxidase family protein [Arthrobacter globiformis]MDQ0617924.1 YfiH family protein [Arthrobacter globiformis]
MFLWRAEVQPGVSVAFTDTNAGNLALHVGDDAAAVLGRRARLEHIAGIAPRRFQYMNQVHGNEVSLVVEPDAGVESGTAGEPSPPAPTADALVSLGGPLAVMVADCIPLVLVGAGSSGPVLSAVHAGRPGLFSGVIPAAVEQMRAFGATDIRAWLGPSVCGNCYEVPAELRDEVAAVLASAWSTTSWGTPALDLPGGAASQLDALGVPVEYRGPCTLENESLFSYRRDSRSGRFAGLVWTHD